MNIYNLTTSNNINNGPKLALSITMDNKTQRTYTYEELNKKVDSFAEVLLNANLFPGDRIALIAENTPEWNIGFLAIMKVRCTAVLIDASLSGADILELIDKSDVRLIYTSPKTIDKLGSFLSTDIPTLNLLNNSESFATYPDKVSFSIPKTVDPDEDIATIIFSSGTTRTAAGIMHTHDSLINSTLMCVKSNNLTSHSKFLGIVPNSHIYGLICTVLGPMLIGSDVHHIESISNEGIKAAFSEYKPTIFPGVPKAFELFKAQIIRQIESNKKTKQLYHLFFPICLTLRRKFGFNLGKVVFNSIHEGFGGNMDILCSAGSPMDPDAAEFYFGTGFNLLITYGATETNIPTIGNLKNNLTTDSCGKPYPDVTVRLSDMGEILIKSPYMMKGYFRDDSSTTEAFEDGWFKSGDLGALDEKGNYKVVGRCKENIVLSTGKKITPDDVERKYSGISGISEFIVCGVPAKDNSYDELHAFVIKDNPSLSSTSLLKSIQEKGSTLTQYWKLSKVHFVDEIPKTSLQKPKRYLLKKLALEESAKQMNEIKPISKVKTVTLDIEIINMITKVANLDSAMVSLDSKLFVDLGFDSLNALDLVLQLENKFNVQIDDYLTPDITVKDIIALMESPNQQLIASDKFSIYPKAKNYIHYTIFKYTGWLARAFYKITVKNSTVIPNNSGYIICANHVSYFDYLWLTISFKKEQFLTFSCMAKKEIFNHSFISTLLSQVCGMIPVNRGNINSESMNCCKKKLKEEWGLLIHPEGSRSDNGRLGMLKKGAAVLAIESNVPIIPAYINGAYEIFPKGKKLPKLFNFKNMKKYPVEVSYGNPISPTNLTVDELIKQVELSILALQSKYTGVAL